ncbi:PrgI family protein [Patescibacteria group bacterium]|nr:PrgI family protein [Patescibacteria group bacterium]MBU1663269.1 PrgI family protein [Patescibacteria group bacterium]MBU1933863.1 PrgI family protein [Patescibacteria group bacterium]MBU2007993.1 PrgI family protein [Patescibacteria group bacterium]MBU2233562.1 PrgI family protein [Patescibacteria group bacterium]
MQQFIVPQFIDVEDKIIGPVTVRQFIIILAGFLIIAISYKIFSFSLFVIFSLFTLSVTCVFAFLKINGRPFHYFILNLFQTFKRSKLRVWSAGSWLQADNYGIEESHFIPVATAVLNKHYTTSRLAELSLIVDTKGAYQGGEEEGGASEIKNMKREIN